MKQKQVKGILSPPAVWVCAAALVVLMLLTGCDPNTPNTPKQSKATIIAQATETCDKAVSRIVGKTLASPATGVYSNGIVLTYEDDYTCNVTSDGKTLDSVKKQDLFLCRRFAPNPSLWCDLPPLEKYSGFAPQCYPLLLAGEESFDECWRKAKAEDYEQRKAKAESPAAKARRKEAVRQSHLGEAEPKAKVFLACKTEGIWDTLTKANIAGRDAFGNKVHEFVAIGLCIWIPKSAKCVITDTDIWNGINEIYVNDRGPVYAQSNTSCKRRY